MDSLRSLRTVRWKLIWDSVQGRLEFYDLRQDPGELTIWRSRRNKRLRY
jgi:hypothetical protein